jgi:AbrB family looped-hinge helix DNA binding protein
MVHLETTATTKGQIVIPSSMRRKLGITAGTRINVELDEENSQIILRPITREYIERLSGRFRGSPLLKDLERERREDKEREDRKFEKFNNK